MHNKNVYEALCSISSTLSKLINHLYYLLFLNSCDLIIWPFFPSTRGRTYGLHPTHTFHHYIISLECFLLLF